MEVKNDLLRLRHFKNVLAIHTEKELVKFQLLHLLSSFQNSHGTSLIVLLKEVSSTLAPLPYITWFSLTIHFTKRKEWTCV